MTPQINTQQCGSFPEMTSATPKAVVAANYLTRKFNILKMAAAVSHGNRIYRLEKTPI